MSPPEAEAAGGPAELRPFLEPGERVVWSDRPRRPPWALRVLGWPPRTSGQLFRRAAGASLAGAALLVGLAALVRALGGGGAAFALALLGLTGAAALAGLAAARRPAPRYAVTDRGRGIVVAGGRADVFALPPRAELAAADATLELGAIDLGELDLRREPGGERVRRRVRLEGVAYPAIVLDLLRRASPP